MFGENGKKWAQYIVREKEGEDASGLKKYDYNPIFCRNASPQRRG